MFPLRSLGQFRFRFLLIGLSSLLVATFCSQSLQAQTEISFDIPSLLPAYPIMRGSGTESDVSKSEAKSKEASTHIRQAANNHSVFKVRETSTFESRNQLRQVEVVIPVTGESESGSIEVESFRFDVYWNRVAFPLLDYAPRTQTTASIVGPMGVESRKENKRGVGLNLNGKYENFLNGSLNGQWSNNDSTTRRYDEVPQHDVLIASGTSHRGTGAFFRFHPSRIETLEGGRELLMIFEVPEHWRAGLLTIECRANGKRKRFAWSEDFKFGRAFVVPVYMQNDHVARQAATEFIQAENRLHSAWNRYQEGRKKSSHWMSTPDDAGVPANWVHALIQSGDDGYFQQYQRRLPKSVLTEAANFVQKRKALLSFSRSTEIKSKQRWQYANSRRQAMANSGNVTSLRRANKIKRDDGPVVVEGTFEVGGRD